MVDQFDSLPEKGDSLDIEGFRFAVTDVDDKRILMVNVKRLEESSDNIEEEHD